MAVSNFIPQIWSARLADNLNKNLVFGNLVNRDYEGEIKDVGSVVKINQLGAMTISDYDKATGITGAEELDSTLTSLTVNQAKYFNFKVDDIDAVQGRPELIDKAMAQAAFGLRDAMDKAIAASHLEAASANLLGSDGTPIVPTKADAYDNLVDLGVLLDEANVPEYGRFVVVPAWFYGLLLKDDRFTKDPAIMATGYVGEVDGMQVFKSNNVANTAGAKYKIVAGYTGAIAFAQQVLKVEAYRPESSFADAVKGLVTYGHVVVQPSGLAVLTANKA